MLLGNLQPYKGHVNESRYAVRALHDSVIEAVVATGPHAGETIIIPRIPFVLGEEDIFPFQMQRRQFPIRPTFRITCSKSQGQSLSACGIYLDRPFFHMTNYNIVALSRVKDPSNLKILAQNSCFVDQGGHYTDNIVYTEVL